MRFKARYLGILLMIAAVVAALGWVVMVLWNWVVPGLFAASPIISYPRAVGLLVLCRVLFGGFRGPRGGRGRRHWEQWAAMTAEERERFLQNRSASSRCGKE